MKGLAYGILSGLFLLLLGEVLQVSNLRFDPAGSHGRHEIAADRRIVTMAVTASGLVDSTAQLN